jgi:signal transduction histidine kinase
MIVAGPSGQVPDADRRPTILIVDDTLEYVRVLLECLEERGYEVVLAQDGLEGVERAQLVGPDLILLDVLMPGMGGFETCRRLQEIDSCRDIPVIFMTSLSDIDDKIACYAAGGVDYVAKPFQTEEVLARIDTHLSLRAMRRELEERNRQLQIEISIRRKAETVLAGRTAELEYANKGLESFAFLVTHDLKAPLRGIDTYSRMLEESRGGTLDAEASTLVGNIRQGVRRMAILLDDLLAYSRIERQELTAEPVDIADAVRMAVEEQVEAIRKRSIELALTVPPMKVETDLQGLLVVLRNLLSNAIKFTSNVALPRIEIGAHESGERMRLWVRDNGIGFDMKHHDRIFELFQRLQRADEYAGTGVGLALVRKAMARMGGKVWAESAPGAGACFFLEFAK